MRYKTGLVIGRFQPFHKGHAYLLGKALEVADTLIIGVGSSDTIDDDNPFLITTRRNMISQYIQKTGLESRIPKIIDIPDMPDDDEWFEALKKKVGRFDVGIGNNDWVRGIFENARMPFVVIGNYQRDIWEGTQIRELMREKKMWQDRVPEEISHLIQVEGLE